MGRGKGIAGVIAFVSLSLISIGLKISFEPTSSSEEGAMIILVLSLLIWGMGFLIPGIFCLFEIEVKKGLICLYLIIPLILFWFLTYSFIVYALAPSTFMSTFQEYMGIGVGLSIVLGIIAACVSYLQMHQ